METRFLHVVQTGGGEAFHDDLYICILTNECKVEVFMLEAILNNIYVFYFKIPYLYAFNMQMQYALAKISKKVNNRTENIHSLLVNIFTILNCS